MSQFKNLKNYFIYFRYTCYHLCLYELVFINIEAILKCFAFIKYLSLAMLYARNSISFRFHYEEDNNFILHSSHKKTQVCIEQSYHVKEL